jgi:histidinol phosphatase-like enzyme
MGGSAISSRGTRGDSAAEPERLPRCGCYGPALCRKRPDTTESLEALHRVMCEALAAARARIDDVYYCPHGLESGCTCRKPAPGMLLEAARRYKIALPVSRMIGDSESDMEAGRRAGCKTALHRQLLLIAHNQLRSAAPSLYDAVRKILNQGNNPGQVYDTAIESRMSS